MNNCQKVLEVPYHFCMLCFLRFHLELDLNYKLVRKTRSTQKLKFQRHPQLSEIITPESLVGLKLMGSCQKYVKVFYNIGVEGFLTLHSNWSQTFRYLRMRNSVQKRILAARSTLKSHYS
jgi:hypothetical protein